MEMARANYGQQKELKEEKQAEVERLKEFLEKEKVNLSQQKIEKEHLLEVTENNEKTYQQLLAAAQAEKEALEKTEKLEQLRVIENGFAILVGKVKHTCDGIDTPQQYAEFVKRYYQNTTKIYPEILSVEGS